MKRLLIGILISWVLWGCNQSDAVDPDGSNEVQITSRVMTRAGLDQGFEVGDNIGLYMTAEAFRSAGFSRADQSWLRNHPFALQADNSWKAWYAAQWENPSAVADAVGYYPYDETNFEVTELKQLPCRVAADQRTLDSLRYSDFLWARTDGASQKDGLLSLAFRHRMSKVIFRLQVTSSNDQLDLNKVHVWFYDVCTAATVDLNSGEVTAVANSKKDVEAYYDPATAQVVVMLIPQTLSANSRVDFFFGDETSFRAVEYRFNEEVTLASGKEYLIDFVHQF